MSVVYVSDSSGNRHRMVGPKELVTKHNLTVSSANTNISGASFTPSFAPSIIKIYVNYSGTSPNFLLIRTNATVAVTETFPLTTGVPQIISVFSTVGDTFAIQFSATGTLNKLSVQEIIPQS